MNLLICATFLLIISRLSCLSNLTDCPPSPSGIILLAAGINDFKRAALRRRNTPSLGINWNLNTRLTHKL